MILPTLSAHVIVGLRLARELPEFCLQDDQYENLTVVLCARFMLVDLIIRSIVLLCCSCVFEVFTLRCFVIIAPFPYFCEYLYR